jgi:hypothetical protein
MWNPRSLKLNAVKPQIGLVGQSTKVTVQGEGIAQGATVLLVRASGHLHPQDVITADGLTIKGQFEAQFTAALEGTSPGRYDILIWNPPLDDDKANPDHTSERYVFEGAFRVKRP